MVACPLCILGLSEEEHTPENWERMADDPEWQAIVEKHWEENPGVLEEGQSNGGLSNL